MKRKISILFLLLFFLSPVLFAHVMPIYISPVEVFSSFIWLGITHIIPKGTDHILFMLGIYFIVQPMPSVIRQMSIFTLAHSITLFISTFSIISYIPYYIEIIIALSIFFLGIENILLKKPPKYRWLIIFLFGLIHGLGFATSFRNALIAYAHNLEISTLLSSLLGFNIGIELAQLSIILAAYLLTLSLRRKPWYKKAILLPINCFISLSGIALLLLLLF